MDPIPAPEYVRLDYRTRWLLFRSTYQAVTAGAFVIAIIVAYFTFGRVADQRWPDRYHPGVDLVLRSVPNPNPEAGDILLAWRHPDGRVSTPASADFANSGQVMVFALEYWLGLHCALFYSGVLLIQRYCRRLGLPLDECDFWTMWTRNPEAVSNLRPGMVREG